jgi:broad specificity phosphatase PhoE
MRRAMFSYYKKQIAVLIFSSLFHFSLFAEAPPVYIDSSHEFRQIPSIATDAYTYLKQAKKSRRVARFIFVRHGESTSNQQRGVAGRTLDVDLSEKGSQQAQETGTQLFDNQANLDAAYSSPSLRTRKTADFILQCFDQIGSLHLDERLYEKYYGPYEGATEEEYAPIKKLEEIENSGSHKSFKEKFNFKAHSEMESLADVYARTIHFINEVAPQHQGQHVLVTTHNAVMKALFLADCAKQGIDVDYRSYDLGNCSVIVLEVEHDEINIKSTHGLNFREKKIH